MTYHPEHPYQDLPPLPPEGVDLESKTIYRTLTKAVASLAALEERCKTLPNSNVLVSTIPLLEARASSEIENIFTTTDELFESMSVGGENVSGATKETMRYREALWKGVENLKERPLTAASTAELCSTLRGVDMSFRTGTGTKIAHAGTKKARYTPPEGEKVIHEKLGNWESFYHYENDIHALVRMAVCHYQFEAIHPFSDGNGRTGRIINVLMLIEQGLLSNPILFLSGYIIENKNTYYELLNRVTTHNDWESWVIYMLEAVEVQSQKTLKRVTLIQECLNDYADGFKSMAPKVYSRELVELLFEKPYCRIEDLVVAGLGERHWSSRVLNRLVDEGLLNVIKVGRSNVYINKRFMDVLKQDI